MDVQPKESLDLFAVFHHATVQSVAQAHGHGHLDLIPPCSQSRTGSGPKHRHDLTSEEPHLLKQQLRGFILEQANITKR